MSYNWSIAGLIEKPFCKISLNQLLGEVEIITKMSKIPNYIPKQTSFLKKLLDTNYYICKHDINGVEGVTLYHNDKIICISQDGYTFMELEYRGRGLGAEILAELYVSFPYIMINRLDGSITRKYTAAGIKSVKKAYELMIERGAILGA